MFHEISHTYFPFYTGGNERKYAWMDEGWAAYLPAELSHELTPEGEYLSTVVRGYEVLAGQEIELPLMVPSFHHNTYRSLRVASYTRPAMAFHFLRDALGDELFKKATAEFVNRWKGKHPIPYDFFNTFEDVTGQDLEWFWNPWFFEHGYPDLAIKKVTDKNEVLIENKGNIPVTIEIVYETEGGRTGNIRRSTDVWSDGKKLIKIPIATDENLKTLQLGNKNIPDINRKNNHFENSMQ